MEERDMKKVMRACLAVAVLAGLTGVAAAQAPAPAHTKVTLTELHCMGCARKISNKVMAVPGVAEMRVDLKARTVFVIHKQGLTPSPRGLWDAIEQADHTPTRMDTPAASYTSKPQS
jgi:copper chaperone CopZ